MARILMPHATHLTPTPPRWQRWLGLSEVWAGGALSARVLVLLRWLAAIGQGVTLYIVWRLGVEVPWWQCGGAVMVTVISMFCYLIKQAPLL